MLTAQALFVLGSALCGSARNMNWLIAGRGEYSYESKYILCLNFWF